ncbi:polysaccharide ABC transporter ATP-binding protein [Lacinutrix sp. 5H-3-7-4]|uniref:ABC transporter ATP-binding protein n=1 Tax=Lacinutrix sp. (strain 5H-3-7-4) TaxID=983544 RepID=UPI00020A3841|nr:polysaccharide ABC transporter ATP-binding protein [Lacinutrix sp. 5H-3-7-4]AEG99976.1 Teichoic-acid-transporting ATPase [Lacinutrix sp. 5H-3-7-4]
MAKKDIILKAENISKQYRLGLVGTGTISHDLNRWWHRIRGKQDPYLKVGEHNDRSTKGSSDYVWALQDINFEVKRGEVLGIIGKNGAGKSTLLKILSKVTSPTTGEIKTKGRIASLLEVGTGFHGEMTGRENVYLNGAILGMTKKEIGSKIDEIIDFSGCERYIDTPVKRYSSGMTVRLAFAVAAFLEPEILVIDEVLAVGDAEFQKKAIGKMQDISRGEGRTVLFVSHDMGAIQSLCNRVILLDKGMISFEGETNEALNVYKKQKNRNIRVRKVNDFFSYLDCKAKNDKLLNIESDIELVFNFNVLKPLNKDVYMDIAIKNDLDERVLHFKMDYTNFNISFCKTGKSLIKIYIKKPNLIPGEYNIDIYLYDKDNINYLWMESASFFVINGENEFTNQLTFNALRAKTLPSYNYSQNIAE